MAVCVKCPGELQRLEYLVGRRHRDLRSDSSRHIRDFGFSSENANKTTKVRAAGELLDRRSALNSVGLPSKRR